MSAPPVFNTHLSKEVYEELIETANAIAKPGKGIFAADESTETIGKKFGPISLENNVESRRLYRQMLFSCPEIESYISGVILHDETVYQKDDKGVRFVDALKSKKIVPGIKVDKGLVTLSGTNSESATQGLDDLKNRCDEYYKQGCRFAKWRAVFKISDNEPSTLAIIENTNSLARYASICQESRLVPIVEPEVLLNGKHDILKCQKVTEKVLAATMKALSDYNVLLEGMLLKPNMVTAGHECPKQAGSTEIGSYTMLTLQRTIPPIVPGIMFLSGGQSEEDATINLNSINSAGKKPWIVSFSYGRALQTSALKAWSGKPEAIEKGHQELLKRMKANSQATLGNYIAGSAASGATSTKSNFVQKHTY